MNETQPDQVILTFIERDTEKVIKANSDDVIGLSLLEVAHKYNVDLEGACEGSLACSTCHIIVEEEWYDKLIPATEAEEDMLDLAFDLSKTSRLGCQIIITKELNGLTVRLPSATRNIKI